MTDAFREDPVRILRLAWLCGALTDFSSRPTMELMRRDGGGRREVDAPGARARGQEISRGLMEACAPAHVRDPARMWALVRLRPNPRQALGAPAPEYHPRSDCGVHMP